MTEKLDTGPILLKEDVLINYEDDAVTLSEKLSHLAAETIIKAMRMIDEGPVVFTPQDDSNATCAPKLHKDDGLINWGKNAGEIFNQIRGILPWPGTFTHWNGKLLKVWKAKVISDEGANPHSGEVESVGKDGIAVNAGCGKVLLEELQLSGGRRLTARDFVSGHNLTPGTILG
jgi:methionyl-tRNA formyltransferase